MSSLKPIQNKENAARAARFPHKGLQFTKSRVFLWKSVAHIDKFHVQVIQCK